MIKIICLGKIKEKYLNDALDDYFKRISKYHNIEIIELKDNENILIENNSLKKYIDNKNYNIALCIEKEKISSNNFASLIDNSLMKYGNIFFFIGSSNGLSDEVKSMMNKLVSFGDITMPHGLFRVVLLEQIYRAFKINNNETYHK